MKNRMKQLLSLGLALVMLLSMSPLALAEEFSEDSIPEDSIPAEETVLDNTADLSDAVQEEEPESSDPAEEIPDGDNTADAELLDDAAETVTSDTAAFPGMGEGYVLSEDQLTLKADLAAHQVPETLAELTEGVDYAAGELIALADTEEEAQQIAAAYDADLVDYSYGVATLQLRNATVLEAVTAAADPDICLPAVDPNYIIEVVPIEDDGAGDVALEESVPTQASWQSWYENSANPDPYLSDPFTYEYQWMHDMVNTYEAWGVTSGSRSIKVAVVDSGVEASHEDLAGKVTCINIGLGTSDGNGHGTAMAGIIAATADNGAGGAGIAPDVSILSIRVLNASGAGSTENIIKGINAAVSNGAAIINLSLGGYFYTASENAAIQRAVSSNVTVIAAMGNDGTNQINYPAGYNNVIAVAAVDELGNRTYFSNYGDWCDVSAPGNNIETTSPGNDYSRGDGTSQATAVVSGVAALYMSKVGRVDPATMTAVLKSATNKCADKGMGAGIVDASKLFSGDKTAPVIYFLDESGRSVSASDGLSAQGKICISYGSSANDDREVIIYSTNGKDPAIKNGEITNGFIYDAKTGIVPYEIASVGSTLTIKAAVVSGMGVLSKVTTAKVKIVASTLPTSIEILTAGVIEAGSSATLTAKIEPAYASQSVLWSVVSPKLSYIQIDSNGKMTFPQNYSGTVVVKAACAANKSIYTQVTLQVNAAKNSPTTAVSLPKTGTLYYNSSDYEPLNVSAVITFANGTSAASLSADNPKGLLCQWTSDKTSVATVDEYGTVTPVGKGTANITCKVLDGTGKSAKMKVTVSKWVDTISVSGQDSIAPGANCTYKATILPNDAANKKVEWTIANAPMGVTVDSKGKVTVAGYTAYGSSFTLTATATDGSGIYESRTVLIKPKTTTLSISSATNNYGLNEAWSKGNISSLYLFALDPVDYEAYHNGNNPTTVQLLAYTSNNAPLVWTSDKPGVAAVDGNGLVQAVSAGKAKITCTANDGSGKKVTVTVNVTIPASSIYVSAAASTAAEQFNLGFGKSMTFKATLGDTYGKPTNTKVTWDFNLYDREWNSRNSEYTYSDWTSYAKRYGYVKIDSNGKLTVSKNLYSDWKAIDGDLVVQVYAKTTDGTNLMEYGPEVLLQSCTTKLSAHRIAWYYKDGTVEYYTANFKTAYLSMNSSYELYLEENSYYDNFIVTSSNPNVCGAYIYTNSAGTQFIEVVSGVKAGTAKITVKACDGSGKSYSFNVKVS